MIRLIATDMDGSFLNSGKEFDKSFFQLFKKMKEKRIIFVIASGNQFYHLYNQFQPVSDDIYFIAENGAYITKGKEVLYSFSMNLECVNRVINILDEFPQIMPVIGGVSYSYTLKCYKEYEDEMKRHYDRFRFVESYRDIQDQILKFSIHDPLQNVQKYVSKIEKFLPDDLKIMTSGNEWMDIQHYSIHKGFGIKFLQDQLNISFNECAAFGDQMNDYELLENAGYSYAVENAVPQIKDIACEIVLSNDEQGVQKKIREIIEKHI